MRKGISKFREMLYHTNVYYRDSTDAARIKLWLFFGFCVIAFMVVAVIISVKATADFNNTYMTDFATARQSNDPLQISRSLELGLDKMTVLGYTKGHVRLVMPSTPNDDLSKVTEMVQTAIVQADALAIRTKMGTPEYALGMAELRARVDRMFYTESNTAHTGVPATIWLYEGAWVKANGYWGQAFRSWDWALWISLQLALLGGLVFWVLSELLIWGLDKTADWGAGQATS